MKRRVTGLAVTLCLLASPAWAQVARFPTGLNVSVLRPSAININWILSGAAGGQGRSTVGLFQPNNPGTVVANCSTATAIGRIDTTVNTNIGSGGTGRAVETLVIPSTVADRALKLKLNQFFYCRVFSGSFGATAANNVTCRQGSSAFANFSVARVELFFENQRREITVPLGQPNLRVFADVAYNGSGVLRAVWEVAETSVSDGALGAQVNAPPTTFSTEVAPQLIPPASVFRTLHVINQFISFGDRLLLTMPSAPPLPTSQPGRYVVNLRFIEPAVGFSIPVARYFVASREHAQRIFQIAPQTPGDSAVLAVQPFAFRWAAAPRVTQYRLDVYPQETVSLPPFPSLVQGPATNPSTDSSVFVRAPRELGGAPSEAALSALIPSGVTSLTLRPNQLGKLAPGRSYQWQVKGLDEQGTVVAESPLRQFTLQAR